jgi:hypothetical protein
MLQSKLWHQPLHIVQSHIQAKLYHAMQHWSAHFSITKSTPFILHLKYQRFWQIILCPVINSFHLHVKWHFSHVNIFGNLLVYYLHFEQHFDVSLTESSFFNLYHHLIINRGWCFRSQFCFHLQARKIPNLTDPLDGVILSHWAPYPKGQPD